MTATQELEPDLATPPRAPGPKSQRYLGLDGLRGAAALVVLICHSVLMAPTFHNAYLNPAAVPRGTAGWWASFSPLHLFWAGGEAVYVFFILSGFVLVLPFLKSGPKLARWAAYYPKRLVRLYVPVWGAFALFLFWITVVPREANPNFVPYLTMQIPNVTAESARADLTLFPAPTANMSVLWSLRMEVVFSLLLPLYVLLGRRLPVLNALKFVILLGTSMWFANSGYTLKSYLPMFGLGTIMAMERPRLAMLGEKIRVSRYRGGIWSIVVMATAVMLTSYWTMLGLTLDPLRIVALGPWVRGITLLGACLLLFLALEGPARRPLSSWPGQWLGSRSFSLYVVHQPIVVSVGVLLGGNPGAGWTLAVAVPAALIVAEIFYRLVERPSLMLCRTLGKGIERGLARFGPSPRPAGRPA